MICPYCSHNDDKVIDSRSSDGGRVIRRRRECLHCKRRYTTYERVEQTSRLMVVKRDGRRVPFNAENVLRGVQSACGKRPVSEEAKRLLVEAVEDELHREFEREVGSREIGQRVMRRLRDLDEVAYIRFASEHLQHQGADDVLQEAQALKDHPKDDKNQAPLFGENGAPAPPSAPVRPAAHTRADPLPSPPHPSPALHSPKG